MRTTLLRYIAICSILATVAMGAVEDYEVQQQQTFQTWQMPGISASSPTGYGAQWGQIFAGGGVVNRNRGGQTSDGGIGFGTGFGNPSKNVGIEMSIGITDVSGFDRGGLSLKAHRNLGKGWGLSIGRENTAIWGAGNDATGSNYLSVSRIFFLKAENKWFSALTLTGGLGDGRFRTTSQIATDSGINVFGGAAIRIQQPVSFIAEWAGQDMNLGLSLTPFRKIPFFLNPTLLDVTGNAGDGTRFSFSGGMAYAFN